MQPSPTSLISTLEVFTQTILNVLSSFQLVGLLPYGIDGIHHISKYHGQWGALDVIAHANRLSSGLWYGKGSLKTFFWDSQYSHTQETASVIEPLLLSSRNFCPVLLLEWTVLLAYSRYDNFIDSISGTACTIPVYLEDVLDTLNRNTVRWDTALDSPYSALWKAWLWQMTHSSYLWTCITIPIAAKC